MTTRDLVLVSLFAAIIMALGLIPPITIGFFPVPITAQTLGVMLAGVVLGARRAALVIVLVLVLVAAGLPVLAPGRGGLSQFVAPTSGFLFGWLPGAWLTGYLAERFIGTGRTAFSQALVFFLASVAGGIVVIYTGGVLWLSGFVGMNFLAALKASAIFIPGDLVKAILAALAGRAVLAGYPLLPARGAR